MEPSVQKGKYYKQKSEKRSIQIKSMKSLLINCIPVLSGFTDSETPSNFQLLKVAFVTFFPFYFSFYFPNGLFRFNYFFPLTPCPSDSFLWPFFSPVLAAEKLRTFFNYNIEVEVTSITLIFSSIFWARGRKGEGKGEGKGREIIYAIQKRNRIAH